MPVKKYSKPEAIIVLLLLVSLIIQSFISLENNSVAWDETCFIGHGKAIFDTGYMRYMLLMDHPPLSYYINSIFLLPLKFDKKIFEPAPESGIECYKIGERVLFQSGYDFEKILFLSRLPFIFVSVILAFYVLKWASELYGKKSGIVALFLYSFSPSIIAYSSLAVSDFVVAAMIFISTYHFYSLLMQKSKRRMLFAGISFGLALLSSAASLLLIPLFAMIGLKAVKEKRLKAKALMKYYFIIFIIAFIVILAFHKFQFGTFNGSLPPGRYSEVARKELAKLPFSAQLLFVYDRVPLPVPVFIGSIGTIFYLSVQKKYGYAFGRVTDGVVWYFALLTFLIKTNLPLLIILLLLIAFRKKLPEKEAIAGMSLVLPVILILLVFSGTNKMSGVRHILGIYPFIFVLAGSIINIKIKRKKYFNVFIAILLFFYALGTLSVAPHYLSYINMISSGPDNGWKITVGSNIDWGQDLKGLKDYMGKNNIGKIKLSYFGSVDPKHYNISYEYMPSPYFQPWDPNYSVVQQSRYEDCSERKGLIAISVTNLQNVYLVNKTCYAWLKNYEPKAKIGYSIFIYDIK